MDQGFRADIIVNDKVIIELKSFEMLPVHPEQLRTCLRHTGLRLGMLINLNEDKLTNGIKRIVNGLTE